MKFTHSKVEVKPLYAFSVSFSKSYGLIGFDFGKHSFQAVLWNPQTFTMTEKR